MLSFCRYLNHILLIEIIEIECVRGKERKREKSNGKRKTKISLIAIFGMVKLCIKTKMKVLARNSFGRTSTDKIGVSLSAAHFQLYLH